MTAEDARKRSAQAVEAMLGSAFQAIAYAADQGRRMASVEFDDSRLCALAVALLKDRGFRVHRENASYRISKHLLVISWY